MNSLWNFLRLPLRAKATLIEVLFWVVFVRASLILLPFRWLFACSRRCERHRLLAPLPETVLVDLLLARTVRRVSRRVPGATCLAQALALQGLLARRGWRSSLRIGVRKDGSLLQAHAWLQTCHGAVIGGSETLETYVPILSGLMNQ